MAVASVPAQDGFKHRVSLSGGCCFRRRMDKNIRTQERMEEFGERCRCLTKERHSVSHQSRHFTEYTEEEEKKKKGKRKNGKSNGRKRVWK